MGRRQRMQRGGMYSMSDATDPKIARMERPAFATSREVPGAPTMVPSMAADPAATSGPARRTPRCPRHLLQCPAAPRPDPRGLEHARRMDHFPPLLPTQVFLASLLNQQTVTHQSHPICSSYGCSRLVPRYPTNLGELPSSGWVGRKVEGCGP